MAKDPTQAMHAAAARLPDVITGSSCNQTSFKRGKSAFLYLGPGPKGQGFKAMFKLQRSLPQAEKLAAEDPARVQLGSTSWVTARFSAEVPLAKSIWQKWIQESYELSQK